MIGLIYLHVSHFASVKTAEYIIFGYLRVLKGEAILPYAVFQQAIQSLSLAV